MDERRTLSRPTWRRRLVWLGIAFASGLLGFLAPIDAQARLVLAITLFGMTMWVSETLPLAVTALGVSFLLVLVAGMDATDTFANYFDPVIVLLLGGFTLGVALSKHGLDHALAALVMRRAGTRPAMVLLAIMGMTATFSMWISNTASTAIMLPIALGVLTVNGITRTGSNLARVLVLGVAFAANLGGIGTPIGTPANPIALRFLADAGIQLTFLGWMVRTIPLLVVMLVAAWWILLRVFPPDEVALVPHLGPVRFDPRQRRVVVIFSITVLLWLTTDLHHVSASLVAIVPILLLFGTGLLDETDIPKAGWSVLLLIGGGLALGDAVTASGLDGAFAGAIEATVGDQSRLVAFLVVAVAGVVMTLMSSNTAAAVIMVPIALRLGTGWDIPLEAIAMLAAVSLSMDFLVPVGTPPNAMAYGTGHIHVREMLQAGSWVTVVAVLVLTGIAWAFW